MTPKNKIPAEIQKMLDAAPEFTTDEVGVRPGQVVGRGFAAHRDLINRAGRPKSADPRVSVSIRLPKSYVEKIRSTGRGWQTRLGAYISNGIKAGVL